MGLINNFIEKRVNKAINELTMRNNFEPTNKSAKKKNFFIKAIGLINNSPIGRDTLVAPEYNFEEIRRAIETDSYIKITLDKHSRLIYKAGYYLKSENEEAIKYLKTRFRLMSYSTGIPTVISVLKKNRTNKDVLFIDASKGFEKGKNQNILRNEDIDKIINTYKERKDVKRYCLL